MITQLVLKDLRAHKATMLGSLLFGIAFINFTAYFDPPSLGEYVQTSAVFIIAAVGGGLFKEKEANDDILGHSLPGTRRGLVFGRYLTSLTVVALGAGLWLPLTYLSGRINSGLGFAMADLLQPKPLLTGLLIMLFQISLFVPAVFRFGKFMILPFFIASIMAPIVVGIKFLHIKGDEFTPRFTPADGPLYVWFGLVVLVALGLSVAASIALNNRRTL